MENHVRRRITPYLSVLTLCTFLGAAAFADEIRLERRADWDSWTFPRSAVAQNDDGTIGLQRVGEAINAAADSRQFLHAIKSSKTLVAGGIRNVGSGAETVDHVFDGQADTWWQPSADDALEDWWFGLDLGRVVYATKIRLIFPDTTDAVPFRNFSVFVSDGARFNAAKDVFAFTRAGRTIQPNHERVVEFDLRTIEPGGATGDFLTLSDTLGFVGVQYVRFLVDEEQAGAALAEIEVVAIGENLALGSIDRGGSVRVGTDVQNSASFSDGDENTKWTVTGLNNWLDEGHYMDWDLGAAYWLNQMVMEVSVPGHRTLYVEDFEVSTSDGTPVDGLTTDRVRSPVDYELLTLVDAKPSPIQRWFELNFPPRKARHVFFRRVGFSNRRVWYTILEYALYGEGYVAEVELTSDFIDLGGTNSIRTLSWDADLPPGTYLEVRSQTGDTFVIENKYYRKNGEEVTQNQWNKLPSSQKLDIVEIQRRGADWSGWSPAYITPDGVFQSPSPRRYVQLQVKMGNDNPDVAPLLRHIALQFDAALVSGGVTSRILPRQVAFDSLQVFTFVLKPDFRSGDRGFDRVLIQTPDAVGEVKVRVGGLDVVPLAVEMQDDLLRVDLSRRVRQDSVEVAFETRIHANATAFDAWVSSVGEDLRQGVRPEAREATTVFVPTVARGGRLIRLVDVAPLVTPNGDGVNDEATIDFVLAKVEGTGAEVRVSIHDLSGRRLRMVAANGDGYSWDGRDERGRLLPPGTYVCRIELAADIGEQSVQRVVNLAY